MTDKRTGPEAPSGRRRKRAAPTIELAATEVPPADAPAAPDAQPEPRPAANEEPSAEPQAAPEPPPRAAGPRTYVVALASGIVGAAIMTGVLAGLWYAGLLPLPSNDAQVAALQGQLRALQNRPPPADAKAFDALRTRVEQIAGEIAQLPPGDKSVAERLAASNNALKSLGIALTALNHRNDDIAADAKLARERADAAEKAVTELRASLQIVAKNASGRIPAGALASLQKRVFTLEQSVKTARAEIAKNSTTDRAARLALSAAALRDAVERRQPYAAELAQVKSLGADAKILAPLAAFAIKGVPSKPALANELSVLLPAALKASGEQATPNGFLDRLQANASKLVRIEPVKAPRGDAPADVLARIAVEASKADIDGALTDLAKLPQEVRAPAQGWIARVKARQAALAAARQFAADSASTLGKP